MTASQSRDAGIASPALLMADPARAAMLTALLDDRPLAASELARVAAVSAPAASAHLAKLLDGGLVTVVRQGRHRYYRLAGAEVAAAIEALSQLGAPAPVRSLRQSRLAAALAEARTCYDHLAGRAGVELLDSMLRADMLAEVNGDTDLASVRYRLTRSGASRLASFGMNPDPPKISRRRFAGACLDWTQRQPHLGGALAAAITARLFELGWIERGSRSRSVRITPAGAAGLTATFGWEGGATAA